MKNWLIKMSLMLVAVFGFSMPLSAQAFTIPWTPALWYRDVDHDGYGDSTASGRHFHLPGTVKDNRDCNDSDSAVNPAATETWYDGVDQNCDGLSDYDQDGDSYDSMNYSGGNDCDDLNVIIYPEQIYNYTSGVAGYSTIQAAVDAAADGDHIGVCAFGDETGVNFYGRSNITLEDLDNDLSYSDAVSSGISPRSGRSCVMIQDSTNITISGFSIGHCSADGSTMIPDGSVANTNGGGIYINNSSATLDNNFIFNNTAQNGGGIYVTDSTLDIINGADIYGNTASNLGGGVYVTGASTVAFQSYAGSAYSNDYGVYIDDSTTSAITVTLNLSTFVANAVSDIGFASGGTYDYTLRPDTITCDSATASCHI